MVTNREGLLSLDNHLYNFSITLNFPKNLITNKQILKKLMEHRSSLTLKEEEEDFKLILENISIASAASISSSRNNDLMAPVLVRQSEALLI